MNDLRKRFGRLVASHRRRTGMTQEKLAESASISTDMVSKIEIGASGASFNVIERLAEALGVDPAEFFTTDLPAGSNRSAAFANLNARLAGLSDTDLQWAQGVLEAALRGRK